LKSILAFVLLTLLAGGVILTRNANTIARDGKKSTNTTQLTGKSTVPNAVAGAVEKGAKWLASVQGEDGGWGQDGGHSSNVRQGVALETQGNDAANTALAALALLRAGNQYRSNVERAVGFILKRVEASPVEGLSITEARQQTQVQRKLGPYIDTFLASMLLAKVDGTFAKAENVRIRAGLKKCVAKIEKNQMKDGSWNLAGGWAPVLGTSLASRSLYEAGRKGVAVDALVQSRADAYAVNSQKASGGSGGSPVRDGRLSSTESVSLSVDGASAGVDLYKDAQALEQLSRTAESRQKNQAEIAAINSKLSDARFVEGYGSIGGEEFFSYLNISDSLKRANGKEWSQWYSKITEKILKMQNGDGTWAGHHCITGRCAVTSAAILNLIPDRED
jgi:hypothetical protein